MAKGSDTQIQITLPNQLLTQMACGELLIVPLTALAVVGKEVVWRWREFTLRDQAASSDR